MRKNSLLYYVVLVAFAALVPVLYQQAAAKRARANASAAHAQPTEHVQQAAAAPPSAAHPTRAPHARVPAQTAAIETPEWRARISNLNGGVVSFTLKDPQFQQKGRPVDVVTTDKAAYYPLTFELRGAALESGPWPMQQLSARAVRLHTEADGISVERKLEAGDGPYQLWLTTTLQNRDQRPRKLAMVENTFHYVARSAESGRIPLLPARSSAISNGLCYHDHELEREARKSLSTERDFRGNVRFVGIENVYFLNALVAVGDQAADSCSLESSDRGRDERGNPLGTLFTANLHHPELTLAPGQTQTVRTLAYLGPKTPEELSRAGHSLRKAINTGFFTSLADGLTALLALIHRGVGNWGIAIILLTFFVKLVLYPLTHKQMESMAKMKELKPEMDRINALYADDREKKGAAVMELYRKKGVNPMAGCFPVVLQLPIWFSLYSSLSSNIRLLNAPFALWWTDLSSPDPYFVLPLALGVLMFVQQRLAPPSGADPVQAKMMQYLMPVMITSFMLFLPAGLCLYMFTNSALSILQQRIIESRLKNHVEASASSSSPKALVAADAQQAVSSGERDKAVQRRLRRGRK